MSFNAASTTSVTFTLSIQNIFGLYQKLFPELCTVDHKISIHSSPYTQNFPFQVIWQGDFFLKMWNCVAYSKASQLQA